MDRNSHYSMYHAARLIFAPIFIGMLTAQTIATSFVYVSNSRILAATEAIDKAGLLPIPSGPAISALKSFGAVFWGGLFFTLSIGIGLTLVSWAAIRLWDLLFKRNPSVLAGYGALWLGLLVFVNFKGWALYPTMFCLLVPLATVTTTVWSLRSTPESKSILWLTPAITLLILTALWATQLNSHLFTTIRDHILLSNPAGRSVNDFYYRYTLYAAEAFKSFEQKTVRTGKLEGFTNDRLRRILKMRLAKLDVLVLEKIEQPDITVSPSKGGVALTASNKMVETTINQFLADPSSWLLKLSDTSDRMAHFRKMVLIGLLTGFPILLFIMVYGLLRTVLGWVATEQRTVWIASAVCLGVGIMLFLPMLSVRPLQITEEKINQALASDQWTHRVAALRHIESLQLEIARYPSYRDLVSSTMVVERYWMARALAKSRVASTYPQLLRLLNDPHPNVICQTFYALGERGQRRAIDPIKQKLVNSDHWYAQWYGYRALRRLGWHQIPSE